MAAWHAGIRPRSFFSGTGRDERIPTAPFREDALRFCLSQESETDQSARYLEFHVELRNETQTFVSRFSDGNGQIR
jgi:hypothetical protein